MFVRLHSQISELYVRVIPVIFSDSAMGGQNDRPSRLTALAQLFLTFSFLYFLVSPALLSRFGRAREAREERTEITLSHLI